MMTCYLSGAEYLRTRVRSIALLGIAAFVCSVASTQAAGDPVSSFHASDGPYASLRGGAVFLRDADVSSSPLGLPSGIVEAGFDPGFGVAGAVGYLWAFYKNDARLEVEVSYRENAIDEFNALDLPFSAAGDVSSFAVMANAYYDIYLSERWLSYLGVGIGGARISVDEASVAGIPIGSDEDTVFAYQFIVGFGYAVNPVMLLSIDYRYFATADPEFDVLIESEYGSHNLFFGVRFSF